LGRTGRAIKNSVDMNLCIDAMKTLFTYPNIGKFVLATGDRDFIPLVNTIRQQGKEVIVIGIGGAASAHLAQSADEFIFYESLVGKKPSDLQQDTPKAKMPAKGREHEAEVEEPSPERGRERERERDREREQEAPRAEVAGQPDIYDTLVNAINLARERGYVCSFGSLKLLMKELMGGDFKEGRYKDASGRPFAKFKDFVLEAERRGKVQVFTRGTVNEVFLPGEDPYKLSQFAGEIKEEPGAPLIEVSEQEVRPESRSTIAQNGRRRRRRRSQRGAIPQNGEAQGALAEEAEEAPETALPELALPSLYDPYASQGEAEVLAEAVFEELLDRVEDEQAATEPLAEIGEQEAAAIEAQAAELEAAPEAEPRQAEGQVPSGQPFTDDERQILREVVARFDRPVSFQQIHDALRNARNSTGISRTNEELRSLIKQAINGGVLERIGKGNRITYRLAAPPEEVAAPDQAQQIAPAAEDPAESGTPTEQAPEFYTPEAAAQAEMAEASAESAQQVEVETTAQPARRRRRKKTESAAEAAPAAEEAPAKPRRTRRKKTEPAAEAAPAAEEAPAKPRRTRRKKTDTAES
jgi:hypothetical protein